MFGARVAPRFCHSSEMLIAEISDGKTTMKKVIPTIEPGLAGRLDTLQNMNVDTLVCGGMEREFLDSMSEAGIRVIDNVAGEAGQVLSRFIAGSLLPWHGYSNKSVERIDEASHRNNAREIQAHAVDERAVTGEASGFDCTACQGQECLIGKDCAGIARLSLQQAASTTVSQEIRMGAYVSSDCLGIMCRMEEFIEYCTGMEYSTIGLAFCVDLMKESRILVDLLRRKFKVVAVGCKVGAVDKTDLNLPRMTSSAFEPACNPVGQAMILKKNNCDIAVSVGLCMGADVVFQRNLSVPHTCLIVKDKLLANNPSAALFSKFHVRNIIGGL